MEQTEEDSDTGSASAPVANSHGGAIMISAAQYMALHAALAFGAWSER